MKGKLAKVTSLWLVFVLVLTSLMTVTLLTAKPVEAG